MLMDFFIFIFLSILLIKRYCPTFYSLFIGISPYIVFCCLLLKIMSVEKRINFSKTM